MALIVEDGTQVSGANSYVTTTEADSYFTDRGNTLWTETAADEDKEAALIKAAYYMESKYRMQWKGSRMAWNQALSWPRRGVDVPDFFDPFYKNRFVPPSFQDTTFVPENVVPDQVKQAQMMLAAETLDSAGASTGTLQAALGRLTKREKAGALEVEYMPGTEGTTRQTTVYWEAHHLLQPFLSPIRNTGQVLRG
jgi:hypothetical protein